MIYVTGDVHGYFGRIVRFCAQAHTSRDDVLVLLGDTCINYWGDRSDLELKERLAQLPVTLLCIHGNHEMRPESVDGYEQVPWCEGQVFVQSAYPNLLFAKDGSIFDLEGWRCLVAGGAYSIDKEFRRADGRRWFAHEQPGPMERADVERACEEAHWEVDAVFSHTCPIERRPTDAFLARVSQREVDTSTEEWLTSIEQRLNFKRWLHGHFHVDRYSDGRVWTLFKDVIELQSGERVYGCKEDVALLRRGWACDRDMGRVIRAADASKM